MRLDFKRFCLKKLRFIHHELRYSRERHEYVFIVKWLRPNCWKDLEDQIAAHVESEFRLRLNVVQILIYFRLSLISHHFGTCMDDTTSSTVKAL